MRDMGGEDTAEHTPAPTRQRGDKGRADGGQATEAAERTSAQERPGDRDLALVLFLESRDNQHPDGF